MWARFLSDYGMVFVLLALCAVLSLVTWSDQYSSGAAGGADLAYDVITATPSGARLLIVVRAPGEDEAFTRALEQSLTQSGRVVMEVVRGQPSDARAALKHYATAPEKPLAIAATGEAGEWALLQDIGGAFPTMADIKVLVPRTYASPLFLRPANLLNIANQIAIIAIVAIGMTMVILTGGIDLSVGSVIALSAVLATFCIREYAGAEQATAGGMIACCVAAIVMCGLIGLVNGLLVTLFEAPPFIITLGMLLIARGVAFLVAHGQAIYQLPPEFTALGIGTVAGVPIAVVLMLILYVVAHFIMSHTTLGRYIYAVGSNVKAARYSGVPVQRILVLVYVIAGLLAGLGGVIMASQLKSAAPIYAQNYELNVIVAVVIGGTSLSGGEGKMLGTLIGALLIAVVQNGMNLLKVEYHAQLVVLGSVLIAAVLLDRLKRKSWGWLRRGKT